MIFFTWRSEGAVSITFEGIKQSKNQLAIQEQMKSLPSACPEAIYIGLCSLMARLKESIRSNCSFQINLTPKHSVRYLRGFSFQYSVSCSVFSAIVLCDN